eukprot:2221724-Amphidinium_carterae.2
MNEPQEKTAKAKKSKKQKGPDDDPVETAATALPLTSCSSSSSSSFMVTRPEKQSPVTYQATPQLSVVPEVLSEHRLATVAEVEVTPLRQGDRYEKPTAEVLEALKHALFSSLPPEDYLKRKAKAEALRLSTSCPVEPLQAAQVECDTSPNWTGIFGLVGSSGRQPRLSLPSLERCPKDILRARAEVLSDDARMCGQIGYLTLNGIKAGGPTICETAGSDAMDQIREQVFLKDWQAGLGASIDDDDMADDDQNLTHAEQCFVRHDIAKLRSMLVAALPLKEHFIALRREEDQRIVPMNKHDKVDYELPSATCLRVSPWSYVLSLGADSDEFVPTDTRHLGGSTFPSSSSSCCISSWMGHRPLLVSTSCFPPCLVVGYIGGGHGAESLFSTLGSPSSSSSS